MAKEELGKLSKKVIGHHRYAWYLFLAGTVCFAVSAGLFWILESGWLIP